MAGNRLQYLTANDWVLIQSKTSRRTFKLEEEIIPQGRGGDMIFIIRARASFRGASRNRHASDPTLW